jgi:hypothetical protein
MRILNMKNGLITIMMNDYNLQTAVVHYLEI